MDPELSSLDKSKITALQQKRTLAFVNHFVQANVQFLNNFMRTCEDKLIEFERQLDKVNASMVLLESKLSSIPELDIPNDPANEPQTTVASEEKVVQDIPTTENEPAEEIQDAKTEIRQEYERFIKMVQVGVPLQAVKLKVSLEGLDPNVFESIINK